MAENNRERLDEGNIENVVDAPSTDNEGGFDETMANGASLAVTSGSNSGTSCTGSGISFETTSGSTSGAFSHPYDAADTRLKCRFTTRGLHRICPYEIPDCIGGTLFGSELTFDERLCRIPAEEDLKLPGEAKFPVAQTQKEKWNRHNVGKDNNTIYQEAKWKG